MAFQMQVRILERDETGGRIYVWRSVRPTSGQPYEYDTEVEARRVLEMCYPDSCLDDVRVIEVPANGANPRQ